MPRRERPDQTRRSEHWLRVAVNERTDALNTRIAELFDWSPADPIEWRSPVKSDRYAEYYDEEFLTCLGIKDLRVPLSEFWPPSGPRWDGLARTNSGKLILVEAKAHIPETIAYGSRAGAESLAKIRAALASAKKAFGASDEAPWETPFYQYANRLAHLYFLRELNGLDAYLLLLYFADAEDVPDPCSEKEWVGAIRLTDAVLGLGKHRFRPYVGHLIWRPSIG